MIKPFYQIHLKILALLAAIILWFIVITVENTVYKFPEQLSIEPLNLGKNVALESPLPPVDVYLRVDKDDMKKITKNDFDISLDLADVQIGEQSMDLDVNSKNPLAQVLKVEPSELLVRISPVVEKEVEITLIVEGKPAEGYELAQTELESHTVKISGAQSVIDKIDNIEAKLILDGTQTQNLKQSVELALPETLNIAQELVTYSPAEMVVNVQIISASDEKEVSILPAFRNEAEELEYAGRISISPEKISIKGKSSQLAEIGNIKTNPIEISALIRNRTIETGLQLPGDVELVNPEDKITVNLNEIFLDDGPTI